MTATQHDGRRPRAYRVVLAALAALDAIALAVEAHRAGAHPRPGATPLVVALSSLPVVCAVAAVAVVASAAFARARRPVRTGCVALGALGVLAHVDAGLRYGPQHAFFVVGATLGGWLFGLAFARRLAGADAWPEKDAEALAEVGAMAAFAATYVGAGISKLTTAGFLWADTTTLRATVLVNHAVDDSSLLGVYVRIIVDHPAAAQALSTLTLVIQLGAFVYVLGPRARMLWGILLLLFHLNVFLLAGILYFQAVALLLTFSFPWARIFRQKAPPATLPTVPEEALRRNALRVTGALAIVVACAWLLRLVRG